MWQSLLLHLQYLEYFHVNSRFQLSFWKYRTLHLHLPKEFSCRTYGIKRIPGLIPHSRYSMNQHFYPQLGDTLNLFIWVLKKIYFSVDMKIMC